MNAQTSKLPRARAHYLTTRRGQLARLTFDPRGVYGLPDTGRWTLAIPCGFYRSCAAGWRIARLAFTFQSYPRAWQPHAKGPRFSVARENW